MLPPNEQVTIPPHTPGSSNPILLFIQMYGHLMRFSCFKNFISQGPIFISREGLGRICKECYTKIPVILRRNYVRRDTWHSIGETIGVYTKCRNCRQEIIYPRGRAFNCVDCICQFSLSTNRILLGFETEVEPR